MWTIPPARMTDVVNTASQLTHVDDNQVRNAYNRTDYLERRLPMMVWWREYIEQVSLGGLSIIGTASLKTV
ncbi:hypothetical protein I3259_07475 [Photobacterium sp. Ph5]|nr:hypothetical protein [Photobacterium sp. Ph6]MCG3875399.1 hypothetical protein [Photobacterium sp. Ph5]